MSGHINPDLVALILKLSPAKTILRCRSVCKIWKQLIDSQSFTVAHLAVQRPRLIVQRLPYKYLVIDPHTLPDFNTLTGPTEFDDEHNYSCFVVSSVHGVICLFDKEEGVLLLWNPSIRRRLRFPLPHLPACGLEFVDYKHCSLWIDPSNNDTKIAVCCFRVKQIALFSSRTQAWTQIGMGLVENCWASGNFRQVVINGVAYWTVNIGVCETRGVVVYFDFIRDEFGTIDMPVELGMQSYNTNIWKWQEYCLSLLHWEDNRCSLWALQNGLWSKMLSVDLEDQVWDVLFVEESLGRVLVETCQGHLLWYDPKIRRKGFSLKSDLLVPMESDFLVPMKYTVANEFVESLVFPDLKFMSNKCD